MVFGLIELAEITSPQQLADPLTKALKPTDFEYFTNIFFNKNNL